MPARTQPLPADVNELLERLQSHGCLDAPLPVPSARVVQVPLERVFETTAHRRESVTLLRVECGRGRGEAFVHERSGWTMSQCLEIIRAIDPARISLFSILALPASPARNALSAAALDHHCKMQERRAWELLGKPKPSGVTSMVTMSRAESAAECAARYPGFRQFKIKAGPEDVVERVTAIRHAIPDARILVDGNEGWTPAEVRASAEQLHSLGVFCLEQPVPSHLEHELAGASLPVPLCADESIQGEPTRVELEAAAEIYSLVNLKLDKSGGLISALDTMALAKSAGLGVLVGCMVSTSLAIAPALIAAAEADYADLDGPLHLPKDETPALRYSEGVLSVPEPSLWG